jgi:phage-related protein
MATFNWTPDRNYTETNKMDTTTVSFGDGYSHRMAKSINPRLMNWNLSFKNRTTAEIKEIEDFIVQHGGVEFFYWSPPNCNDLEVYKVICAQWNTTTPVVGIQSLSCTFTRVYE